MRTAPGKQMGYIVCPVLIPPSADAETWLANSDPDEGWEALGQVLLALRAHDSRIEDELADMLTLYVPPEPPTQTAVVAFVREDSNRISYQVHTAKPGETVEAVDRVVRGESTPAQEGFLRVDEQSWTGAGEPIMVITGRPVPSGEPELRICGVERHRSGAPKSRSGSLLPPVSADRTKQRARKMINNGDGRKLPDREARRRERERKRKVREEQRMSQQLQLSLEAAGGAITVNLLEKSGLTGNRVRRDLNVLRESVTEAAHHLRSDNLKADLDRHFGLDNLDREARAKQADGCTIAALLMMNAAMLHQRIANGRWLSGIEGMEAVKNATDPIKGAARNWERITRQDFLPVVMPAREAVYAIEETGRSSGLERALRHIASEAERIAETYADMGADHAGPLFNEVMGNQASDGAYFTRPPAATMAARLALDASGEQDWTNLETWRNHKAVDLACGSGTLLTALLTEMKNRAHTQGATERQLASMQKLAVEETLKGMDINAVSLQLAATQLTAGNSDIRYNGMGLYRMPYGPTGDPIVPIAAGSLELIAEEELVPRHTAEMFASAAQGSAMKASLSDPDVERAARAALGSRIGIMNPPFTERERMGQKFPKNVKERLRNRVDGLEDTLVDAVPALEGFVTRRSLRPMFVALADQCISQEDGVLAMILPTVALANHSGTVERRLLADRFALDTVVTCHQPANINFSQNTSINESIVVLRRDPGDRPPARFIALDRFPKNDAEVAELFSAVEEGGIGVLADGWGETSQWPADCVQRGDWTSAIWRSPVLAAAATEFAEHEALRPFDELGVACHLTRPALATRHRAAAVDSSRAFPILKSKGADGQQRVEAAPDERWEYDGQGPSPVLGKAGHLLVTAGQRTNTGRVTAVASATAYVGHGWMPVTGLTAEEARGAAVFLNSTIGRLLLMRTPGRTLDFPNYTPAVINSLPVPDLSDSRVLNVLSGCWQATRDLTVPQFRDGECDVRRLWDEAVAEAIGWDADHLAELRMLLHREPHVCGRGYGQYADLVEPDEPDSG